MSEDESKKRFKRHLRHRVIIFLSIMAIFMYVFGFSWNSFEIKLLVLIFGVMAIASTGFHFFKYLDIRNMSVLEYLNEIFGAERHYYIWYIVGAISVGFIATKVLIG